MKRGLLAVLILTILGVSGFVGWNNLQNKPEKKNSNTHQTNDDPSEGGKYLVIKEWGVRMELGDTIKDAKYRFTKNSQSVYLSTETVEKVPGCQLGNILGIERAKKGETIGTLVFDDVPSGQVNPFTKIDEHYYHLIGPGLGCADQSDTRGKEILNQARQELSKAYHRLEKIPTE